MLVVLLCVILIASAHAIPQGQHQSQSLYELHVSPNGIDTASATLHEPIATLTRARDMIRELKSKFNGTLNAPVNVYLRSGKYHLNDTFVIEEHDGGDDHAPISYMRYPGDEAPAVVSGGLVLSQWSKSNTNQNIWQTKVPNVGSGFYPKQFWINDQRRFRARLPSLDKYYYWTSLFSGDQMPWGFYYNSSDPLKEYHNLADADLVMYHAWTASHHVIKHIDQNNHTVHFVNPTGQISVPETAASGSRYYIDNVIEGLDEPGEWYLDRTTGILSYYAYPNEDVSSAVTVVSHLDVVTEVKGTYNKPVQHLSFVQITFEINEWYCPPLPAQCDGQGANYMNTSAILVSNANFITFSNVTVWHTGTMAIWLLYNTTDVMINYLNATDLGAGGVRVGYGQEAGVARITVQNSYILNGGKVLYEGMGIFSQIASYNHYVHNEIGHFAYTGISVGWSWGYASSSAHNNTIAYNHIYDIGKNTLSDMGGVYTLGVSPGTIVYNNLIHDVYSFNYGGWGLYPDEGSSDQVWSMNVVYNTKSSGLHQHYGENNTISNNVFAFNGWEDGSIRTDPGTRDNSFTFTKNIIYATNASLFYGDWQQRKTNNYNEFYFNKNVYYQATGNYAFGDNLSFSQWQASGQDKNSTLADPKFINPSQYNFHLQSNSPALALGIQQIDTSLVGPILNNYNNNRQQATNYAKININ